MTSVPRLFCRSSQWLSGRAFSRRRVPKKEWKGRQRLQMRGKWKTTGNRTYGAYSISLNHFALESGDVDEPLALDLDLHFAVDLHSHTTEREVSNSAEHDLIALRATLTTR